MYAQMLAKTGLSGKSWIFNNTIMLLYRQVLHEAMVRRYFVAAPIRTLWDYRNNIRITVAQVIRKPLGVEEDWATTEHGSHVACHCTFFTVWLFRESKHWQLQRALWSMIGSPACLWVKGAACFGEMTRISFSWIVNLLLLLAGDRL
jgi:hypothetical protein